MMKKSLLALSVAAAAMGAQAADVQVYGLIDTSLSFVSSDADIAGSAATTRSTAASRSSPSRSSSAIRNSRPGRVPVSDTTASWP